MKLASCLYLFNQFSHGPCGSNGKTLPKEPCVKNHRWIEPLNTTKQKPCLTPQPSSPSDSIITPHFCSSKSFTVRFVFKNKLRGPYLTRLTYGQSKVIRRFSCFVSSPSPNFQLVLSRILPFNVKRVFPLVETITSVAPFCEFFNGSKFESGDRHRSRKTWAVTSLIGWFRGAFFSMLILVCSSCFCNARLAELSPWISRFDARSVNVNATSSSASPQTTISQNIRSQRLFIRPQGKRSFGLSENLWCSAQTSPQHPIPTTMMLTASTNSQNQSEYGDVKDKNIEAVIHSNYVAAICAFASAVMLFLLGIWGAMKK